MARELAYATKEHDLLAIGVLDDSKTDLPTPTHPSFQNCSIASPSSLSLTTAERPSLMAVARPHMSTLFPRGSKLEVYTVRDDGRYHRHETHARAH